MLGLQIGRVIHLEEFDSLVAVLLCEQLHLVFPIVSILLLQCSLVFKFALISFTNGLNVLPK